MSGRSAKDKGIRTKHYTKAEKEKRVRVIEKTIEGMPEQPSDPAIRGDHRIMEIWKRTAKKLSDGHKLAKSDGDFLIAYAQAILAGNNEAASAIVQAVWAKRVPYCDLAANAAVDTDTIEGFIEQVALERRTFAARVVPYSTVTLELNNQPYAWREGDAAEVTRRYATDVLSGAIVAGDSLKRSCRRFLDDLETGASRGLWFDVVAARHIVQFSEKFCDLILLPWQVFCLANIFGWKVSSGARRFTEAWISCAKKNGKTRLASTVALFGLIADQEQYPDIFCAATKKEQANLVFRDAYRCCSNNQKLREYVQRWRFALSVGGLENASFTPLSSDTKSMDGLRPHFIIADEIAFWSDPDQWEKLQKGTVIRVSPLILATSTAGDSKECFAFRMFEVAERVLRGVKDDKVFVCIFAVDPKDDTLKNSACWAKANPSLNVTVKEEHIEKARDEVLQNPARLNKWLQLNCNIWPDLSLNRIGSIPAEKWDACAGLDLIGDGKLSPMEAYLEFMRLNMDVPLFAGLDIGLVSDLSVFAMLWPRGRFQEGGELLRKRVLLVQAFMPEEGLAEKERAWSVPLSQWVREGWIQLVPSDMVDPREIKKWILSFCSKFFIRELGADPYHARVLGAELSESGVVKCIEVTQNAKELTAPAQEFLTAINRKDLVHFGNPYLNWNAHNVILAEDERHGGIIPEKLAYKEKIDGIQAALDAFHRLVAQPPESVYLDRGISFV